MDHIKIAPKNTKIRLKYPYVTYDFNFYSVSCDLSAEPVGNGRHRDRVKLKFKFFKLKFL